MDLSMYRSCQGLVGIAIAVISEAACVSRSKIVTEVTSEQTNTQQEKKNSKKRTRMRMRTEPRQETKTKQKQGLWLWPKNIKTNGVLNITTGRTEVTRSKRSKGHTFPIACKALPGFFFH